MFNFFKNKISATYAHLSAKIGSLFSSLTLNDAFFKELETAMLRADMGTRITNMLIQKLRSSYGNASSQEAYNALKQELLTLLNKQPLPTIHDIILLVGINGSGKTTAAGKLAYQLTQQNNKILLVAGDTFRAAATEQLQEWAHKVGCDIVKGTQGQDPASVIFQGCATFKQGNYNKLIIDTAGRLQTKAHLMKELEKITKIIHKQLPEHKITTLLTIDAMLGQNSFEQAQIFNETTHIDGIILTKMDGTAKGGIIFNISDTLNIPVAYISSGEKVQDLHSFDRSLFVDAFLST